MLKNALISLSRRLLPSLSWREQFRVADTGTPQCPQMKLLRIEGSLYGAARDAMTRLVWPAWRRRLIEGANGPIA